MCSATDIRPFLHRKIIRLYVFNTDECALLRGVTQQGCVLTLGVFHSEASAQAALTMLLPHLRPDLPSCRK